MVEVTREEELQAEGSYAKSFAGLIQTEAFVKFMELIEQTYMLCEIDGATTGIPALETFATLVFASGLNYGAGHPVDSVRILDDEVFGAGFNQASNESGNVLFEQLVAAYETVV